MAEEPQESSKFDLSEFEKTSPETPKAKKRAKTEPVAPRSGPKPAAEHPLPGVHERTKKKGGRKLSSEGKLNAAVSGEIGGKSEVEEQLGVLRGIEEERVWEDKIAEAKEGIEAEERRKAGRKSDVEESLDELRGIEEERVWEETIADAKKKADAEGQVIEIEAEPASDEERAEELAWDEKLAAAKAKAAEEERAIAAYVEAHPESRPMDAEYSQAEEAWFKKGEDPEHVKAQAQRQHEEEGRKIKDVRRQIAETYDEQATETVLDTQGEIDATVRQAEDMLKRDELNLDTFDIRDYEFLLTEQARLDRELESAGWWAARKLRGELKEIRRDLDGYESQIRSVINERARARKEPEALTRKEKEDIRYKGPMPKQALPKGSGTSVHTKGFFSRLFGKK